MVEMALTILKPHRGAYSLAKKRPGQLEGVLLMKVYTSNIFLTAI